MAKEIINIAFATEIEGLRKASSLIHNILNESGLIATEFEKELRIMANQLSSVIRTGERMASSTKLVKSDMLEFVQLMRLVESSQKNVNQMVEELTNRLLLNDEVALDYMKKIAEQRQRLEELNKQYNETVKQYQKIQGYANKYNVDLNKAAKNEEYRLEKLKEINKEIDIIKNRTSESAKRQQYQLDIVRAELDKRKTKNKIVQQQAFLEKEIKKVNNSITKQETELEKIKTTKREEAEKELTAMREYVKLLEKTDENVKQLATSPDVRERRVGEQIPGRQKTEQRGLIKSATQVMIFYAIIRKAQQIIRDAIRTVQELDHAFTTVSMVTSMTREETLGLMSAYQDLAKEVGVTTSEIAKLSIYFFRQGRSAKSALELTRVAALAAKVAGIDAAESADYLTSAINGFHMATSDALEVSDKFSALAASAAVSYEEMAIALQKVAPAANVAGVEIDYMMGFIAKGIETTREAPENIGTAFKTIFARMKELKDLGKTVEDGVDVNKVEAALNSIGVKLRDANGEFRTAQEVLVETGKKWDTLTNNQQAYIATALAGTRQQARLLALFENFDRTLELVEESQNSAGATMAQHSEYMKGMEAALQGFETAWQKLITTFVDSEVIIDIINTASKALDGLANFFDNLGTNGQRMFVVLGALAGAFTVLKIKTIQQSTALQLGNMQLMAYTKQTLLSVVADKIKNAALTKNIQQLGVIRGLLKTTGVLHAWNALKSLANAAAQIVYMKATRGATVATTGFATALSVATGGLILIIPLATALVAIFAKLARNQKGVNQGMLDFLNPIKNVMSIINSIGRIFKSLFSILKLFYQTLKRVITQSKALGWAFNVLLGIASPLLIVVKGLQVAFDFLADILEKIVFSLETSEDTAKRVSSEIAKLNNEIYKTKKASRDLQSLVDRFNELDAKSIKTAEDFEEMRNIIDELSEMEYKEVSFVVDPDNMILNMNAINAQLEQYEKDLISKQKETFTKLKKAMVKGSNIVDDPVLANASAEYAKSFMKPIADGLDQAEEDLQKEIQEYTESVLADFDVNKFRQNITEEVARYHDLYPLVKNQKWLDKGLNAIGFILGKNVRFYEKETYSQKETDKAIKEAVKNIQDNTEKYFTRIQELEQNALKNNTEVLISDRVKAYDEYYNAVKEIDENAAKRILMMNQDINAWSVLISDYGISESIANMAYNFSISADKLIDAGKKLDEIGAPVNLEEFMSFLNNMDLENMTKSEFIIQLEEQIEDLGLSTANSNQLMNLFLDSLNNKPVSQLALDIQGLSSQYDNLKESIKNYQEGTLEPDKIVELTEKYGADVVKVLKGEMSINELLKERSKIQKQALEDKLTELKSQKKLGEEQDYILDSQIAAVELLLENYENITSTVKTLKELLEEIKNISTLYTDAADIYGIDSPITQLIKDINDAKFAAAFDSATKNLADNYKEVANLYSLLSEKYSDYYDIATGILDEDKISELSEATQEKLHKIITSYENSIESFLDAQETYTNLYEQQQKLLEADYKRQEEIIKNLADERINALEAEYEERQNNLKYAEKMKEKEEEMLEINRQIAALNRGLYDGSEADKEALKERKRLLEQEIEEQIRQRLHEEEIARLEAERDEQLAKLQETNNTRLQQLNETILELIGQMKQEQEETVVLPPITGKGSRDSLIKGIVPLRSFPIVPDYSINNNTASNNNNIDKVEINIHDASDPYKIAEIVRKEFATILPY